jgi:hypothetical protein
MYHEVSLRGYPMVKKSKQRSRNLRPETTTGDKWTNIRNPRATVRFSLDERVAWDDGEYLVMATVIGFDEDECTVKVKLDNGTISFWPTVSARLRRVQTSEYQSVATRIDEKQMPTQEEEITPIGKPVKEVSGYYSEVSLAPEDEDSTTRIQRVDIDSTIPGGDEWEK